MVSINRILKDKDFISKLSLVFFFSISWLSISSNYQNLLIFSSNESITVIQILNFFRTALNILIFPILIFLFIKMLNEIDDFRFKKNLFFLIPLGYFICQIPALFYTTNSIENFYYILSSINFIMIMTLSVKTFKANEILILAYVTFIILFMVLMITFFKDLINFIFNNDIGKKFYGSINTVLGENYIRSSGASRISLILLIIYSTILMRYINSQILKTIPLFVFSTIVFLYESRAGVILLILFIISSFLFNKKEFLKNIKKYLFFCIFFPFLCSIQINYLHSPASGNFRTAEELQVFKKHKELRLSEDRSTLSEDGSTLSEDGSTLSEDGSTLSKDGTALKKIMPNIAFNFLCDVAKCNDNSQRLLNKDKLLTTSGRVDDWKDLIIQFYNKGDNLIFGYGAQGDRYLINQTASNGTLYALSSSGVVGLLFFLTFSIAAGLHILKYFFTNRKNNTINHFSIFILLILGVRSLIESSYALFGIDFILFYMSYALADKYNRI